MTSERTIRLGQAIVNHMNVLPGTRGMLEVYEMIEQAIAEEREACAQVADNNWADTTAARGIAKAIRARK
jgi:dTDP-glucose pyrophosphorylase